MDEKYEYNFKLDCGRQVLVRCPKCNRENYVPNVLSGICTWCKFDINVKENKKENKDD